MGGAVSSVSSVRTRSLLGLQKAQSVLMLGLDGAGKSAILDRMRLDEVVTTTPTIGFTVETVCLESPKAVLTCTVWGVGGSEKTRPLWRQYYRGVSAVIFVVDSTDCERLRQVGEELEQLLREEELADKPFLVFANKQDQPDALSPSDLSQYLGLWRCAEQHQWNVLGCCATTGDGIYEGLDWLSSAVAEKQELPSCLPSPRLMTSQVPVVRRLSDSLSGVLPYLSASSRPKGDMMDVSDSEDSTVDTEAAFDDECPTQTFLA